MKGAYPSASTVRLIRERYPEGCRVMVDKMDDPHGAPEGMTGTVFLVDDIGTLHVEWDNGRVLGLVYGEDRFHKIG